MAKESDSETDYKEKDDDERKKIDEASTRYLNGLDNFIKGTIGYDDLYALKMDYETVIEDRIKRASQVMERARIKLMKGEISENEFKDIETWAETQKNERELAKKKCLDLLYDRNFSLLSRYREDETLGDVFMRAANLYEAARESYYPPYPDRDKWASY